MARRRADAKLAAVAAAEAARAAAAAERLRRAASAAAVRREATELSRVAAVRPDSPRRKGSNITLAPLLPFQFCLCHNLPRLSPQNLCRILRNVEA